MIEINTHMLEHMCPAYNLRNTIGIPPIIGVLLSKAEPLLVGYDDEML